MESGGWGGGDLLLYIIMNFHLFYSAEEWRWKHNRENPIRQRKARVDLVLSLYLSLLQAASLAALSQL